MDFVAGLQSPDPAMALQAMTNAYLHERALCTECRDKRLSKIVNIIADGKVSVQPDDFRTVVQYLIFELADRDLRSQMHLAQRFDLAWALRSLHNIAVAIQQLHAIGIAHQDLKPSNVLVFSKKTSKLGDLGHASVGSTASPLEGRQFAGDPGYAPPEQLYGYQPENWMTRRLACDLYLLGSMIAFMFTGVSMTMVLAARIPEPLLPSNWTGTYDEVIPYLRDRFGSAIDEVMLSVPREIGAELEEALRQLCDPDPSLRGHPLERRPHHNPFDVARYVSLLNKLAKRAEVGLIGDS
jgi:serine/threonine protein kinase